jgi:hypothetical protein
MARASVDQGRRVGLNRSKLPTRLHMEAGVATGKIVVLTRHAGTQSTRP